jgi:hypothetical protein
VFIHALIASVRTCPEPAVFLILHSLNKVFAHLIRRGLRIAMLAHNHLPQLLLVPRIHRILFLRILLRISRVRVQILLGSFPLHVRIVTELAFPSLLAVTLLEKHTEHCLRVDSEWDFLDLYWLEELESFLFGLLGCLLVFLTLGFLCFFSFGIWVLVRGRLGLELGDLFFC